MHGLGDRGYGRRISPEKNNQITVLVTNAINLFKRASVTGPDKKPEIHGKMRVIAGLSTSAIHVVPDET